MVLQTVSSKIGKAPIYKLEKPQIYKIRSTVHMLLLALFPISLQRFVIKKRLLFIALKKQSHLHFVVKEPTKNV